MHRTALQSSAISAFDDDITALQQSAIRGFNAIDITALNLLQ